MKELRQLGRDARRRLARSPAGAVWRRVRGRHRLLPGNRSRSATLPGASPSTRPFPVPATELDRSRYDIPDDAVAAVLDGAFGHGYLLSSTGSPQLPGFLDQWACLRVGPLWLRTAPRTVVTVSGGDDASATHIVILLGHPVDVDLHTTRAAAIADRLRDLLGLENGHDLAVRSAAYLAGRWTAVLVSGGRCTVLTDAMGSQPVFYTHDTDGVTFASSDVLVALAHDLPVEPRLASLEQEIRELHPRGVVYLPGKVTCFEGVAQVVPNCLLTFELTQEPTVTHRRYWPFEPRVEQGDLEAVHAEFADRMRRQLALFAELGPLAWSLTGGLDCRVALAHLDLATAEQSCAFTYLNPRDVERDPTGGAIRDVFVANLLAHRTGLRHRVLRWRQAKKGTTFRRIHDATHPVRPLSHGAAHAMWADLPHDIFEVQGNGGEIGTVFRRDRSTDPLTPAKAAGIWLGSVFASTPRYVDLLADYLEHAHLDDARLLGYSHYDVLYWELRMGRWGWTKFLDGDLSHRILPPFNDRRLLEVMLSLPEEQRVGKALYARVLRDAPLLQVDDD